MITSSQFSAEMARNRALVPREFDFFMPRDRLIGFRNVEMVDAVFLDRFIFIMWVEVPAWSLLGAPIVNDVLFDSWMKKGMFDVWLGRPTKFRVKRTYGCVKIT